MRISVAATLSLKQSATIGAGTARGNTRATLLHVPGQTLRGAVAAAWLALNGPLGASNRDSFVELFEGGVDFLPLHNDKSRFRSLAFKRHKKPRQAGACTQLEWDFFPTPPETCPDCGDRLEFVKQAHAFDQPAPRVKSSSHVELGQDERALDGQLFVRNTIDVDHLSQFYGEITGPEELLTQVSQLKNLRIGGARSVQGAAAFELDTSIRFDAEDRVRRLNATTLSLTIESPAILVDDIGRPSATPAPSHLSDLLGVSVNAVTHEGGSPRWVREGGWHAASGLPKPEELCVAAGSTYMVSLAEPPTVEGLRRLGEAGLGLRTHEGFGTLRVANLVKRHTGKVAS